MSENSDSGGKRLLRLREGRMVAGVCTGLARYLGWDVSLVRLAFGVFLVFYGLGALVYGLAWLILPEEDAEASILASIISGHRP